MKTSQSQARAYALRRLKIARQRFAIEYERGNAPAAVCAIADGERAKDELSKLGRDNDGR